MFPAVPVDVFAKLGKPIVPIRFGSGGDFAVRVAVPKATMNEHDSPILSQDDIRFTRKLPVSGPVDRKSVS